MLEDEVSLSLGIITCFVKLNGSSDSSGNKKAPVIVELGRSLNRLSIARKVSPCSCCTVPQTENFEQPDPTPPSPPKLLGEAWPPSSCSSILTGKKSTSYAFTQGLQMQGRSWHGKPDALHCCTISDVVLTKCPSGHVTASTTLFNRTHLGPPQFWFASRPMLSSSYFE